VPAFNFWIEFAEPNADAQTVLSTIQNEGIQVYGMRLIPGRNGCRSVLALEIDDSAAADSLSKLRQLLACAGNYVVVHK